MSQVGAVSYETEERGDVVKRAIKSHSLWLTLAYLGLILLIAKGYA